MDRERIINNYDKNQFMYFLTQDRTGEVLELFNEEGINIIKRSNLKEDRITYILSFSNYKNELLQNINFLDMFLNTDISKYYAVLGNLNTKTYDAILKRCLELNKEPEFIAKLFSYFDTDYKLESLDTISDYRELLYCILKGDEVKVVEKIMQNYNIDLSSNDINLKRFFSNAKNSVLSAQAKKNKDNEIVSEIHVPSHLITKELAEKLWNNYDIFAVRSIINDVQYCSDPSLLNTYVKYREEQIISSYGIQTLLSPFKELYETFKAYKLEEKKLNNGTIEDSESYDEYRRQFIKNIRKGVIEDNESYYECRKQFIKAVNKIDDENIYENINEKYEGNGLDGVFEYLKVLSGNMLSNYIIDYHFEENYHNIMIDIRELLRFYYDGNIVIPKEREELYSKISNIDYLSVDEKIELHNKMKNFNMIELFYDDMSMARRVVAESIKEYSLSSETLVKYRDDALSKKYGVDVYVLDGNPFFGIVKTGRHVADALPTGHSYSLIGDGGIAVFGNVEDSNTYLYDSDTMNPDQLVHCFPFDSYTFYRPFEQFVEATNKVNTLTTPQQLIDSTLTYNELLLLEKGSRETDIDKSIPELKRMALYCVDEIREQDVLSAKKSDVGILLIDSSKYKKSDKKSSALYRDGLSSWEDNYFDGIYDKEKFEARR